MLEKFDPMAGDEAAILWSKKKVALENITERMRHMDEEVPTRTLMETIADTPVTYPYSRPYPTWQYVPTWNTTTTTGWSITYGGNKKRDESGRFA